MEQVSINGVKVEPSEDEAKADIPTQHGSNDNVTTQTIEPKLEMRSLYSSVVNKSCHVVCQSLLPITEDDEATMRTIQPDIQSTNHAGYEENKHSQSSEAPEQLISVTALVENVHQKGKELERSLEASIWKSRGVPSSTLQVHKMYKRWSNVPVDKQHNSTICGNPSHPTLDKSWTDFAYEVRKPDVNSHFACPHCDNDFTRINYLVQHVLGRHFPFVVKIACPVCPEKPSWKRRRDWLSHVYEVHNGSPRIQPTVSVTFNWQYIPPKKSSSTPFVFHAEVMKDSDLISASSSGVLPKVKGSSIAAELNTICFPDSFNNAGRIEALRSGSKRSGSTTSQSATSIHPACIDDYTPLKRRKSAGCCETDDDVFGRKHVYSPSVCLKAVKSTHFLRSSPSISASSFLPASDGPTERRTSLSFNKSRAIEREQEMPLDASSTISSTTVENTANLVGGTDVAQTNANPPPLSVSEPTFDDLQNTDAKLQKITEELWNGCIQQPTDSWTTTQLLDARKAAQRREAYLSQVSAELDEIRSANWDVSMQLAYDSGYASEKLSMQHKIKHLEAELEQCQQEKAEIMAELKKYEEEETNNQSTPDDSNSRAEPNPTEDTDLTMQVANICALTKVFWQSILRSFAHLTPEQQFREIKLLSESLGSLDWYSVLNVEPRHGTMWDLVSLAMESGALRQTHTPENTK